MAIHVKKRYFLPRQNLDRQGREGVRSEDGLGAEYGNEGWRIVVFDKAYVDFRHLWRLNERGGSWGTRAKDDMLYEVVGQHAGGKWGAVQRGGITWGRGGECRRGVFRIYGTTDVRQTEKHLEKVHCPF